jgi:hypothetical protein
MSSSSESKPLSGAGEDDLIMVAVAITMALVVFFK